MELLDKLNLRLSKSKSQHLLVDEQVLENQLRFANIRRTDRVLEIGAGLGTLTVALAKQAEKVITVEKDQRFKNYLTETLPDNVELIIDDFLDLELPKFDKVVANIPYEISSKIVFKLLNYQFIAGILIFQLEFANRMAAAHGSHDYSRLTVKIHTKAHCEILQQVSRRAFYPVPKVDSAIVELVPRTPSYKIENEALFDKVVDAVFNQRRKMIKNALLNKHKWFKINKDEMKSVVSDLDYGTLRGEKLSPEQLAELANKLYFELQQVRKDNSI
ncbi:MAG: ribosomal RNA small subunit methyltransferase A [Thermoplasmata archaeon]|nr:MAG: ribosomal RNA small subunit methyltransferase A [Thermoplasmata archaeon]